jgi:hypothetical protein
MSAGTSAGTQGPSADDVDADSEDGRRETLNQRMDRNWNELLQELRVTQTGTQILTGFLLSVAFQQKFGELSVFQHRVYLALVLVAVLTTALGLAPVNLHRGLFRHHAKATLVEVAHRILRVTLAGVALVLAGTVLLIFDVVVGRTAGWVAGGCVAVLLVLIGALPRILKVIDPGPDRGAGHPAGEDQPSG